MQKSYQAISRKYRPQKFSEIIGQNAIVTTLQNALKRNSAAHAYLFSGTRGTGKTTLARIFAKALNCSNLKDFEPCDACPSCQEILSGLSLDVLEIDGASNRGIDDIRKINETAGYSPLHGKYKIYIIDEVHMLTKEAFNALLKTLEEPPATVKFFLATTEPHKLPATIISRCQSFSLLRLPEDLISEKLHKILSELKKSSDEEAIRLLASFADGSLRDAESLLDQVLCFGGDSITIDVVTSLLGLLPKELFFELDEAFKKEDESFAFRLAEKIYMAGKDFAYFLEQLTLHFRNILMAKIFLKPTTSPYTEEQCVHILDLILDNREKILHSPFRRIDLEILLLSILKSKRRVPLEIVIERLLELEKKSIFSPPPLPVAKEEVVLTPIPFTLKPTASPTPTASPFSAKTKVHYDTLLRFATVELEGSLQKHQDVYK